MFSFFRIIALFFLFQTPDQQLIGSWRLIEHDSDGKEVKILIFRPDHSFEMITNGKKDETGYWRLTVGQGQNLLSLRNKNNAKDKETEEIFVTVRFTGNQLILAFEEDEIRLEKVY